MGRESQTAGPPHYTDRGSWVIGGGRPESGSRTGWREKLGGPVPGGGKTRRGAKKEPANTAGLEEEYYFIHLLSPDFHFRRRFFADPSGKHGQYAPRGHVWPVRDAPPEHPHKNGRGHRKRVTPARRSPPGGQIRDSWAARGIPPRRPPVVRSGPARPYRCRGRCRHRRSRRRRPAESPGPAD